MVATSDDVVVVAATGGTVVPGRAESAQPAAATANAAKPRTKARTIGTLPRAWIHAHDVVDEIAQVEGFESMLSWVRGTSEDAPFSVEVLEGPRRLVVTLTRS